MLFFLTQLVKLFNWETKRPPTLLDLLKLMASCLIVYLLLQIFLHVLLHALLQIVYDAERHNFPEPVRQCHV